MTRIQQRRRIESRAKKSLSKKYGSLRKAMRKTGLSRSQLLLQEAQQQPQKRTQAYQEGMESFAQHQQQKAVQAKLKETFGSKGVRGITLTTEAKKILQPTRTNFRKKVAGRTLKKDYKPTTQRKRNVIAQEVAYNIKKGIKRKQRREKEKEVEQWKKDTKGMTAKDVFDKIKEINEQYYQFDGKNIPSGMNITEPITIEEETKQKNKEKTTSMGDNISNNESTNVQTNIRDFNVFNNANDWIINKQIHNKRQELIEKYYSSLSPKAMNEITKIHNSIGTRPIDVLTNANSRNFGQDGKIETKLLYQFPFSSATIPEELYVPHLTNKENLDLIYDDILEYYGQKRKSSIGSTANLHKAGLEIGATLVTPAAETAWINNFINMAKGIAMSDAAHNTIGKKLNPQGLKTIGTNINKKLKLPKWFEQAYPQTKKLGNDIIIMSEVLKKAQQGARFVNEITNPKDYNTFLSQSAVWPAYAISGMADMAIEEPITFGAGQYGFSQGIQGVTGALGRYAPKLKIGQKTADFMGRATGDTIDIGSDLIEILPYTPKELWPSTITGITGANYVADYTKPVLQNTYQYAKSIPKVLTKDYYNQWELDPVHQPQWEDSRDAVLNSPIPPRISSKVIQYLKNLNFKGKNPSEIVLKERNIVEQKAKEFLIENSDSVAQKGSRNLYDSMPKGTEIDYPVTKDFDWAVTDGTAKQIAKMIKKQIFNNNAKINYRQTDFGELWQIDGKINGVEGNFDIVNQKPPTVMTNEGVRLVDRKTEVDWRWQGQIQPSMTVRRRKDLPKLAEQLKVERENPDDFIHYEDVFYHAGTIKPTNGKITGKIETASEFEKSYGESNYPILYGGINEFISFFRKGGHKVIRIGTEGTGIKVLRKQDLPSQFQTPASSKKDASLQAKNYLEWVMKNHQGNIVPSAHTIIGRNFKGDLGKIEKEWIIVGEINNLKSTGFGMDFYAKQTRNSKIIDIITNQPKRGTSLPTRFLKNIKSIAKDLKIQSKTFKEVKQNLQNKVTNNEKLLTKEKDLLKNMNNFEESLVNEQINKINKLSDNAKTLTELYNQYNNANNIKVYDNIKYPKNNLRRKKPPRKPIPTYNTNYNNPNYTPTYTRTPTYDRNPTYDRTPAYTRNPTYNRVPTYNRTPTYIREPTKTITTIKVPPPEQITTKIRRKKKKEERQHEGYAPTYIKGTFKKQGRTFATRQMAEWEGMEIVDENPITDYKVEKVKTNKEPMRRKRPTSQLQHKFKTLKNGVKREKRYYGFDKPNERKGSFNMYPYIYGRS